MHKYGHVKSKAVGLNQLAMAFVLPHENKAVRLPIVPATYTALLETMADGTVPVADNATRRAFLCRDAAYPLWMERSCTNMSVFLQSTGTAGSWNLPAQTNRVIVLPQWDYLAVATPAGCAIDGTLTTGGAVTDLFVLGKSSGNGISFYIPYGAFFGIRLYTGAAGGGDGIEFEIISNFQGEEYVNTCIATSVADGFAFQGTPGTTTVSAGVVGEGLVPAGFCYLRAVRTRSVAPTAANPILQIGWTTGGTMSTPSGTALVMVPYSMPPEFNNSTLPYTRTRLNSSAALFTNVTAALSKEGTILAGRLKSAIVDPWNFTSGNINSVHPNFRYFGPMEKGLYTFTTPSANIDSFDDHVYSLPSGSITNSTARPLFGWQEIGIYNAILFSDLGSAAVGTQLAVSSYTHLEFESTSSLFTLGVSTLTLETLHATEVALLKFGHFHENPLHWAAIKAAATSALRFVGPMVAPVVQHYANKAVKAGVAYLTGKPQGDRKMSQKSPYTSKAKALKTKPKPKRARAKK